MPAFRVRQTDGPELFRDTLRRSFYRVWPSPIDVHNDIINYPAKRTRQERVPGTKHGTVGILILILIIIMFSCRTNGPSFPQLQASLHVPVGPKFSYCVCAPKLFRTFPYHRAQLITDTRWSPRCHPAKCRFCTRIQRSVKTSIRVIKISAPLLRVRKLNKNSRKLRNETNFTLW